MKAEKVYETFEMPNDKKLGWKIVGGLAFSLIASLLLIICVLYADIIDKVMGFVAYQLFKYPELSGFWIMWAIVLIIYYKIRK